MVSTLESIRRQTWALTKKNFIVAVTRSWGWTLFRAYVLPILLLVLLLEIPNFAKAKDYSGIGSPAAVKTLAQSMDASKKLAIVHNPKLNSDVQDVLDRITEPLGDDQVARLNSADEIWDACSVDYHGNSNCHAVITFNDSPASGIFNATWNYTIQVDPTRQYGNIDVFKHDTVIENFWLPLQVAIDNAIANTTALPEAFSFGWANKAQHDEQVKLSFLDYALSILGFVFFLSMMTVVHHASSMIASERESGLSQLVDTMAGGVAWARVLSYVLFLDLLYLPLWIILGSCKSWRSSGNQATHQYLL
jgi:ATP-binding cassette, subfamily A (ABC1), member 3